MYFPEEYFVKHCTLFSQEIGDPIKTATEIIQIVIN